jgi:perosamine synthetase
MAETFIPLCVPELRGNELKYLKQCVDTNWVSYVGSFVSDFEVAMARFVGTRHAVATNSGTAALHIALLVAGVQPDDEVLVSDLTFIAPANAIRYCNAHPVFMDVTAGYWQMDVEKVKDFFDRECRPEGGRLVNRRTGRRVSAIVPVHILGHPVDIEPLVQLARRYELRVIEDATEALGAQYRGKPVGSHGDLACFSYNGNKIITTGGGGMIATDNAEWAARAKYLTTQARDHGEEYIHESVGYNYRLTNLQAAVGLAQMELLPEYVEIKRGIAARYRAAFDGIPGLSAPPEAPWARSTFWLYTVLVGEEADGADGPTRQAVQQVLGQAQIQARPLWAPIHEQRPYRECQAYRIEVTPRLYRRGLSLPCSVGLTEADQRRVSDTVRHAVAASV